MAISADSVRVLARALDQAGDALDHVRPDRLSLATPCERWDVGTLADHLVNDARLFATTMRGGEADWGQQAPHLTDGWGPAFRAQADDLIHAWHELLSDDGAEAPQPAGMQCAEIAVHTWDLVTALGVPAVSTLDPEVAEASLDFLTGALKPEYRGESFAPEQQPPSGAGPYERLAAFAGRSSA